MERRGNGEEREVKDKSQGRAVLGFMFEGYYVIELAKEQDGVPVYISFGQDRTD